MRASVNTYKRHKRNEVTLSDCVQPRATIIFSYVPEPLATISKGGESGRTEIMRDDLIKQIFSIHWKY